MDKNFIIRYQKEDEISNADDYIRISNNIGIKGCDEKGIQYLNSKMEIVFDNSKIDNDLLFRSSILHYVILEVNRIAEELVLKTNVMASLELFIYEDAKRIYISDDINIILEENDVDRSMDNESLYDILTFGYIRNRKTPFVNIVKVSQATEVKINKNGIEYNKIWNFFEIEINTKLIQRKKDKINNLSSLFKRAIEKSLVNVNGDVIVPLSGGLDSRLILAQLLDLYDKNKIICYTFGQENTQDLEIARDICRYYEIEHIIDIYPSENKIEDQFYSVISSIESAIQKSAGCISIHPEIPGHFKEVPSDIPVYSGFMGDPIFGAHLSKSYTRLEFGLNNQFPARFLSQEECITHKDRAVWDYSVRQQDYIKYGQITRNRKRNIIFTPFTDMKLLEFTSSLDFSDLEKERLYKEYLLDQFPIIFKKFRTTSNYGQSLIVGRKARTIHRGKKYLNKRFGKKLFPIQQKVNGWTINSIYEENVIYRNVIKESFDELVNRGVIPANKNFLELNYLSMSNILTLAKIYKVYS